MPDEGIFYDADANPDALKGKTIAILGYGSQGHAHALNLRDSGARVIVGLRPRSGSWAKALAAGLDVRPVAEAVTAADVIAWCRDHLAHFKAPRTVVFGPLPKTSTGKIQKYVLREQAKAVD